MGRIFSLLALTILIITGLDLATITWRFMDTPHLARGPVPMSRFVETYREQRVHHPQWPSLRWYPVPLRAIPLTLRRAVILGEDGTFYTNDGFDMRAIEGAARYDWRAGHIVFGGSTITQQTAKNMFLNPARTFVRKANETLLTIALAREVSKNRILQLYLDNAQFGRGIYGVDAASLYYFGKPVYHINRQQAAELAATLPDPTGSNPATQSRYFKERTRKILWLLRLTYGPSRSASPSKVTLNPQIPPDQNRHTLVLTQSPVSSSRPARIAVK